MTRVVLSHAFPSEKGKDEGREKGKLACITNEVSRRTCSFRLAILSASRSCMCLVIPRANAARPMEVLGGARERGRRLSFDAQAVAFHPTHSLVSEPPPQA